jgi:hypothetical protein
VGAATPLVSFDRLRMLFSPAGQIAFAHFPKTAGTSITSWFRGSFPDAAYVEPGNCHTPVRTSLERLGLVTAPPRRPKILRECLRLVRQVMPPSRHVSERCDVKIIGVVREPFEMLVSLYEYWRRYEFQDEPTEGLIRVARTGNFREFLRLAVGERWLANYRTYFDIDGPAWHSTRLIDFQALEPGLAAVCREFGIEPPAFLDRRNAAPRGARDLGGYLAEAGSLVFEVRSHFRWYYEEAEGVLIRGERPRLRRAA